MAASVTTGRALRYAGGSARGLLHQPLGHCPRLTLDNGKRVIKSTGTDSFEDAKEHAMRLYYETQARIANKLPASTRKFKAVAEHTIQRMQADEAAGVGKQAYRDYQQALRRWLIPYFCTAARF